MSAAFESSPDNHSPIPGEMFPPVALVHYLRSQFQDAYAKDDTERERGLMAPHGKFLRREVLPGDHLGTTDTARIILKPPHPHDQKGFFAEVYAVQLREADGFQVPDTSGLFADQFLLREFTDGLAGPLWLVTEEGIYSADTTEFDVVAGYNSVAETDLFIPLIRAEELLERLSTYNIVASSD